MDIIMKDNRRALILELISKYQIETQEQLCKYLLEAGLNVTQATVSRDIREMKLTKMPIGVNRSIYVNHETSPEYLQPNNLAKQMTVFSEAFISANSAQNIVVVKTMTGMANAVAAVIDSYKFNFILGTIAGDDCIMIVCADEQSAVDFAKKCETKSFVD